MKSRDGKSQRREEKRRRKSSKRESPRRKKIQAREKVGKSQNAVFFQWFVAPEGRKVGSLKRRVRSQLARWEMKSCTPSWREADLQVNKHKTHQVGSTFGSRKVHAVVARTTFPSQNVQNTPGSEHFWKLHISKSKMLKDTTCSDHFLTVRCRFPWQAQGIVHLVKSEQNPQTATTLHLLHITTTTPLHHTTTTTTTALHHTTSSSCGVA